MALEYQTRHDGTRVASKGLGPTNTYQVVDMQTNIPGITANATYDRIGGYYDSIGVSFNWQTMAKAMEQLQQSAS